MFLGNAALKCFNLIIGELDDFARFYIYEMVMMVVGSLLVPRPAISEIMFLQNSRFFEQTDRPIDRSHRYTGINFDRALMNFLDIRMVIGIR